MPGITRDTILQLCRRLAIPVKQKKFTVEEVLDADAAFLVGTAAEVTGIHSVNDHVFPKEWTTTLGHVLQKEYEKATRNVDEWEDIRLG